MRLATLDLSPEIFIQFCTFCKDGPARQFIVKENPLPDDAKIVRVRLSPTRYPDTLQLLIESQSFSEIPDGTEPPELPPVVFQTIHVECSELVA